MPTWERTWRLENIMLDEYHGKTGTVVVSARDERSARNLTVEYALEEGRIPAILTNYISISVIKIRD